MEEFNKLVGEHKRKRIDEIQTKISKYENKIKRMKSDIDEIKSLTVPSMINTRGYAVAPDNGRIMVAIDPNAIQNANRIEQVPDTDSDVDIKKIISRISNCDFNGLGELISSLPRPDIMDESSIKTASQNIENYFNKKNGTDNDINKMIKSISNKMIGLDQKPGNTFENLCSIAQEVADEMRSGFENDPDKLKKVSDLFKGPLFEPVD